MTRGAMTFALIAVLGLIVFGIFFQVGIFVGGRYDSPENTLDEITIRVAALRGPTALGLLWLMNESAEGRAPLEYEFSLLGSPDEVMPLILRGEIDVAAVPSNLAAVLYNRTDGDVVALCVVTLGVLHIVDRSGEVHTIHDLAGRTVHMSGQGSVQEFALNYVLRQNGLTPGVDVTLEFAAEHTQIAAMLEAGQVDVALLPEPFVSTVLAQIPGTRAVLDLSHEWSAVQPDYGMIMSVVVARREFLNMRPGIIAAFLIDYAQSIEFMQQNIPAGAALAVEFGIIPNAAIAEAALPGTNLVFMRGDEMRQNLLGFFGVLYSENPDSIGGRMPGEDFFH